MWSGDQAAAVASLEAAQRLNPGIGYGSLGIVLLPASAGTATRWRC